MKTFVNTKVFELVDATPDPYGYTPLESAQEEVYDLTGSFDDPLRAANTNTITGEKSFFFVNEGSKVRSYLMPAHIPNIRAMKDHIREHFPVED